MKYISQQCLLSKAPCLPLKDHILYKFTLYSESTRPKLKRHSRIVNSKATYLQGTDMFLEGKGKRETACSTCLVRMQGGSLDRFEG